MSEPRELCIPQPAIDDPKSGEVLRAWIADGGLHCSLRPNNWSDPGNWGIVLADVARHVANARQEIDGSDREETLSRILTLFNAEFENPTDEPTGGFVE